MIVVVLRWVSAHGYIRFKKGIWFVICGTRKGIVWFGFASDLLVLFLLSNSKVSFSFVLVFLFDLLSR